MTIPCPTPPAVPLESKLSFLREASSAISRPAVSMKPGFAILPNGCAARCPACGWPGYMCGAAAAAEIQVGSSAASSSAIEPPSCSRLIAAANR